MIRCPIPRLALPVLLLALAGTTACGPPQVELEETYAGVEGEAVFDHSVLSRLLSKHVDAEGLVDYPALAADSDELDGYIASLADAPIDEMGRDERLAFLIDAYNAFTLRLILENYPLDSIKSIPADQRWNAVRWQLPAGTFSLDQIEHQLIRPNFREPRVHFTLVCAAVGCPILRREAYTGARLEEQLEDQARFTNTSERWVRYTEGDEVIQLTRLYDWYGNDFEQVAGSVLAFVARYRDGLAADLAAGHTPRIEFLEYDWALNEQSP